LAKYEKIHLANNTIEDYLAGLFHFNKPLCLAEQLRQLFSLIGISRQFGVLARAESFFPQSQQ
jgi:hypothetical protein